MNESEPDEPGSPVAFTEAILSSLLPDREIPNRWDSRGLFVDLQFVAGLLSEIPGAITEASLIFSGIRTKQVRVCAIGEGLFRRKSQE